MSGLFRSVSRRRKRMVQTCLVRARGSILSPDFSYLIQIATNHTGHAHDGVSHRIRVNVDDLNTTLNRRCNAISRKRQYLDPLEYTWCQAHPGQCNMYNNASYRKFLVSGTTNFTFSPLGRTVRMQPAIMAWQYRRDGKSVRA